MAQKLGEKDVLLASDVVDPTLYELWVNDNESATSRSTRVSLDEATKMWQPTIINKTSHGLVSGDAGKMLSYGPVILDDTNGNHYPIGLLNGVIDANNIKVLVAGQITTLDVSLLENGNLYDPAVDGVYPYWDQSLGQYVGTKPGDSSADLPSVLEIIKVDTSDFTCRLRDFGPIELGSASRKAGWDDMGTLSGAQTVDFTAGSKDNKRINLSGDISFTSITVPAAGNWATLFIIGNGFSVTSWPSNVKPIGSSIPQPISDGYPYHGFSDGTNLFLSSGE